MSSPVDSPRATAGLTPRQPWEMREVDRRTAAAIESGLGLLPATARVLAARGLDSVAAAQSFLRPSLDELHDPFSFHAMDAAVERLRDAIRLQQRVVVHGDYDVDGITGTVLLVTVLRHLGCDAELILPHRIDDGYGLNPSGVDKAAELGAAVLVAVDCGVTAIEACAHARRLGIDVIIADHHVPREELPEAVAILNPRLRDSGYPEENLAAVAIAFKLARGLLARHSGRLSGISMLKLVALGTVADLVPLRGENRVLAFHGLAGLADTVNPGLLALMRVAGVDPRAVSAGDVGFRLAPRINAAGRVGHPAAAAELFLTDDVARARRLAGRLQELNSLRRDLERTVAQEAAAAASGDDGAVVVVWGEGWHRGVIGIVASRLVERWGRPAFVAAVEGGEAHGSARSVPGYDVVGALDAVGDLLSAYGGHRQAAGFRLPAARLGDFRQGLLAHARRSDPGALRSSILCDGALPADEVTTALALEIERLAPFGVGNPRPRFVCRDLRLAAPPRLLKEEHVKLRLRSGESEVEAVGWRRADLADALGGIESVTLVATLKANRWGGRVTPQLEIQDVSA